MAEENKNQQANEPSVFYESKGLKIYANSEDAALAERLFIANQDPIERVKETVQLILRVFPLTEKKPNSNKLYLD